MQTLNKQLAMLVLLFLLFGLVQPAVARDRIELAPHQGGPWIALKKAKLSTGWLPVLRHVKDDKPFTREEYRRWKKGDVLYIPGDAQRDDEKAKQLIAEDHEMFSKKVRKAEASPAAVPAAKSIPCPPAVPCPKCEPKVQVVEKVLEKPVEKIVERPVEKVVVKGSQPAIIITSHQVKIGDQIQFSGISRQDHTLFPDLEYLPQTDIARLSSANGVIAIQGLKPGKVTFVVWSASNPNFKRGIEVKVVGDNAGKKEAGKVRVASSEEDFNTQLLSVLAILLLLGVGSLLAYRKFAQPNSESKVFVAPPSPGPRPRTTLPAPKQPRRRPPVSRRRWV